MHTSAVEPIEFCIRLLLALGLGAGIGMERQLRNHEAGLKTNALVSAGSAIFVMMACTFGEPDRIVAQIVSGIGFLGAGMILRDGVHVRGLNTAATLWCSAAIGALAGAGNRATAGCAAAAVILANVILREIAQLIDARHARAAMEGRSTDGKGQ